MKEILDWDSCKGCGAFSFSLSGGDCGGLVFPGYSHEGDTDICPCVSCIVKCMCRKECDEFFDYRGKYIYTIEKQ